MKRVSTNHPSLRGVACYDCNDDHHQRGWLDETDGAFFCDDCYAERTHKYIMDHPHEVFGSRREAVLRRRFPDYEQRKRAAQRRNLLAALALLTVASLTENFWYVLMTSGLVILTGLPYIVGGREE